VGGSDDDRVGLIGEWACWFWGLIWLWLHWDGSDWIYISCWFERSVAILDFDSMRNWFERIVVDLAFLLHGLVTLLDLSVAMDRMPLLLLTIGCYGRFACCYGQHVGCYGRFDRC